MRASFLTYATATIFGSLPVIALLASQQAPVILIVTAIVSVAVFMLERCDGTRALAAFSLGREFKLWLSVSLFCLCFMAASCLWSIAPDQSLERLNRMVLLIALSFTAYIALERSREVERPVLTVAVLAVLALAALILSEAGLGLLSLTIWASEDGYAQAQVLNRPAAYFIMLAWPAAYAAHRLGRTVLSHGTILTIPVVLFASGNMASTLASVVGVLVFFVALWRRKAVALLLSLGVTILFFAFPFAAANQSLVQSGMELAERTGSFSTAHRVGIWNFTALRSFEKPLLGFGLDSARSIPGAQQPLRDIPTISPYLADSAAQFPTLADSPALPLHPHNAALQIHLELGNVGAGMFCTLFALATFHFARPSRRDAAPYTLAWISSWIVMGLLSVGIWQTWWWALSAIALTQFLVFRRTRVESPDLDIDRPRVA